LSVSRQESIDHGKANGRFCRRARLT